MARHFNLWRKLRQLALLDSRRDKRSGYGPEFVVGRSLEALSSAAAASRTARRSMMSRWHANSLPWAGSPISRRWADGRVATTDA